MKDYIQGIIGIKGDTHLMSEVHCHSERKGCPDTKFFTLDEVKEKGFCLSDIDLTKLTDYEILYLYISRGYYWDAIRSIQITNFNAQQVLFEQDKVIAKGKPIQVTNRLFNGRELKYYPDRIFYVDGKPHLYTIKFYRLWNYGHKGKSGEVEFLRKGSLQKFVFTVNQNLDVIYEPYGIFYGTVPENIPLILTQRICENERSYREWRGEAKKEN